MRKFLKAHCRKTDRWYGLEIEQFGSTWKVVNMIDLSDDEAAVLSSGMPLCVADESCVISSTKQDAYGRSIGVAEVTLTDGTYDGIVVTEQIHPISFLLESN